MVDRSTNISLFIGLALPVVMVAIISAVVFFPSKSLHPTTDFIYVVGSYPSYTTRNGNDATQHDFSIKNGKIVDATTTYNDRGAYIPYPPEKDGTPRFFIHHTSTNTNEEVDLKYLDNFTLSSDRTSPEGLTLTFGKRSYGVFPFFFDSSTDREHAYLSTNKASKEITLISDTSINYYEFQLVGWVTAGQ